MIYLQTFKKEEVKNSSPRGVGKRAYKEKKTRMEETPLIPRM